MTSVARYRAPLRLRNGVDAWTYRPEINCPTQAAKTLDRPVRRYLVRPAKGGVDYLYNEGQATEETRSISLTWETGQDFVDDGITWEVRGVGHYDSAGRMAELVVRGN